MYVRPSVSKVCTPFLRTVFSPRRPACLFGGSAFDSLDFFFLTASSFLFCLLVFLLVLWEQLGKALTDGGGTALPWYGYAAGAVLVAFLLKTVGEIATAAIEEMEEVDP